MKTVYDTIIAPPTKRTGLDRLLSGQKYTPEEKILKVKEIKFHLKYIDGHTGKNLWSLKSKYPGLFESQTNPVDKLSHKFRNKFPFRKQRT